MMNETNETAIQILRTANVFKGTRRVFVHDLVLSARIGIHAHERKTPQRIRINIDLAVSEENGPVDDRLDTVVCYETILQKVRNLVLSGHVNLLETLAERIVSVCLQDVRVQSILIKIEKIDFYKDVGSVGIEIERYNKFLSEETLKKAY